jgi:hypothetical protein
MRDDLVGVRTVSRGADPSLGNREQALTGRLLAPKISQRYSPMVTAARTDEFPRPLGSHVGAPSLDQVRR